MPEKTILLLITYFGTGIAFVSQFWLEIKPYHNYPTQFLIFLGNLLIMSTWPIGMGLFLLYSLINTFRGVEW